MDLALKLNAEICFNKGMGFRSHQWKERILLVGLIAAYNKDFNQAAKWLASGINQLNSKLINRCITYGFSDDFVDWVTVNQDLMITAKGWEEIFKESHNSYEDFIRLIMRITTIVYAMGLKDDVIEIISHIDHLKFQDWKKILLNRLPTTLPYKDKLFSEQEIWYGSYNNIQDKIQLNILTRVFCATREEKSFVTKREYDWLIDNGYKFVASKKFYLLCKAFQQIATRKPDIAVNILEEVIEENRDYFFDLSSRQIPLRIIIGGYGWTGSGAVHDAFKGYPEVKEMSGAGDEIINVNEGAESEPMLHQGPASILAFANQIIKRGNITIAMWENFFRLYVLSDLNHTYFEYKTVLANKEISKQIGSENFYLLSIQFVYSQTKNSAAKNVTIRKKLRITSLKQFEGNIVKSLFNNKEDFVIFNNSVNIQNVGLLKYLGGKSIYIAVNRNIFDQLADQRKCNSFFNISALKFALTKRKKVQRYSKDKKSVANLTGVDLLDIL